MVSTLGASRPPRPMFPTPMPSIQVKPKRLKSELGVKFIICHIQFVLHAFDVQIFLHEHTPTHMALIPNH